MNLRIKHIHFVGIGGCGMSGMAEILRAGGYKVTGSDLAATPVTRRLAKIGARVFKGHSKHHITGADVVVYSSAVPQANPEIVAARAQGVPVIRRAEMLGELMRMKYAVGVAGTHGKTTTTSMIGAVLEAGGLDPTVIVGGIVRHADSGAVVGRGRYLVAEADEFDRSFLKMPSTIAVITTLEADHLDCYRDLDEIKAAFVTFANQVPFYGSVVLCLDEKTIRDVIPALTRNVITYGFSARADTRAADRRFTDQGTSFRVEYRKRALGRVTLRVPGDHNVKNAMAAMAVGMELGIPFGRIAAALGRFKGVRRRFEIKGEKQGVMVVDDYAHHPTEILASLRGAKKTYKRNIIAVFQPHLYSRTRDFYKEFGSSFFDADTLVVTDVYPAREKPVKGVTGRLIAGAAVEFGHKNVKYIKDKERVVPHVRKTVKRGDMVITLGAGDVWKIGEKLLKIL
jgi:UDP-N-acetylmuramate--alanine ligase